MTSLFKDGGRQSISSVLSGFIMINRASYQFTIIFMHFTTSCFRTFYWKDSAFNTLAWVCIGLGLTNLDTILLCFFIVLLLTLGVCLKLLSQSYHSSHSLTTQLSNKGPLTLSNTFGNLGVKFALNFIAWKILHCFDLKKT